MEFAFAESRQQRENGVAPEPSYSTNFKQEAGMIWNLLRSTSHGPALLAGTALVLSLSIAPANAQKAQPCIAGSWELTGALAHTGLAIKMGIDAAVDEINEAGGALGQKLRGTAYDDQGETSRATGSARGISERDNGLNL